MPRRSLIFPVAAVTAAAAAVILAQTPHVDPSRVPGGCGTCHVGHGMTESPMLPAPVVTVCLRCHGTLTDLNRMRASGLLAGDASPRLLSSVLAQPYTHPMDLSASSRSNATTSTCTSCHAPHRGSLDAASERSGAPNRSPADPARFEYELCEQCHGSSGATTQSVTDISRLLYPGNPSYHPVEAPASTSSPSVPDALRGKQINCTDCHGSSETAGPRGPHGSAVQYILRLPYETTDGAESEDRYALCYDCHNRERVLQSSVFAEHGAHIVDVGASCATCHNPHGSVANRALIRFGEETIVAAVAPSASTGRLAFESTGPGSGVCFLTCHGRDHGPETYGAASLKMRRRRAPSVRRSSGRVGG